MRATSRIKWLSKERVWLFELAESNGNPTACKTYVREVSKKKKKSSFPAD